MHDTCIALARDEQRVLGELGKIRREEVLEEGVVGLGYLPRIATKHQRALAA